MKNENFPQIVKIFSRLTVFTKLIPYFHQPKGALFMVTKLTMPGINIVIKPLCGE